MIRIEMNRLKHTVVLELPTDYEHVLVSLWKLGLDRDPVKYTLRELKVVFHYDTSEEHQMIYNGNIFKLRCYAIYIETDTESAEYRLKVIGIISEK
jgi:uncharacterized protein Smg (DUF494 family)